MSYSRIRYRFLVLLFVLPLINPAHELCAKEGTAHISLKKTAIPRQKVRPYVVKKGERLFDIMQNQVGITSHRFAIIKQFNPKLNNLNKIYPGQIIMLPEKEPQESVASEDTASRKVYTTRKGDSMSRIAYRQLNVKPADILKAVKLIAQLNPDIKNLNRIYPGQVLQLPRRSIVITRQDVKAPQVEASEAKKDERKEKIVMPPENRMDIIRQIIGRMNGSLMTAGKYFIPIPQMGQVTIDCAMIPVAELEDGSTILVDFTDRVPESLKKMIQTNWQNYRVVKAGGNDGIISILQKIINASSTYTMSRETKPFSTGKNPTLQFMLDWTISKKTSGKGKPYLQGLIFVSENSQLLPRPMNVYAGKNGLIITEIMDGQGLVGAQDLKYTVPDIPVITGNSAKDMIYALLLTLGYSPVKDTEVRIFDSARDGFNLSIMADLLVKKGDRYVMVHSKQIPQQFMDNLKNRDTDAVFLGEGESRKSVIKKILQVMNIPYTFDTFLFSEPDKASQPRGIIRIPAFKIARDKRSLYLIDFDMDGDIYGHLHHKWEVNLVKF
ncbi:MAG: LysM peptidoglycan-binding domain-containing protein [Deltaproteobacteria bacterium]